MKFITANFGAKILALICAIFMWIYASAGQSKIGYFPGSLYIEPKNTPEGLAAIYDEQKVKIKIQAPYDVWNKLSAEDFGAYVDLSGLSEGTYGVDVKVSVNLPNVVVVEKDPARIIVRIEQVTKKQVPVAVKFEGEVKTGYVTSDVIIKPDKVEVTGAKSLVENLSEAIALIKLSGEDEDFRKTVALGVYNEKGEKVRGLEFDPKNVEVEVPIVTASESKTVGVKAKVRGTPKSDYYVSKIETTPSSIEISGSGSSLKLVQYLETKEINIDAIDKDFEKEIDLVVPTGITVKDKKVKVKISLSNNQADREITATFSYANVGPGLSINSITPNIIKVITSCSIEVANTLSSDKVVVNFNLQGKAAGSYSVSITKDMILVPDKCAVSSWLPSAVTIVLQ
ncbi:MAG: CdaR family protein [Candidatus Berkelbacteria bacterium]|nr:CdaR family protein [Candidatus Berkelbacteria bacterium]